MLNPIDWLKRRKSEAAEEEPPAKARTAPPQPPLPTESLDGLLANVGTQLWRLRRKLSKSTSDPIGVQRYAESMWEQFQQAGIEIRQHEGEPLPQGGSLNLTILTFVTDPNLVREEIIETLRPSVFYRERTLQVGEVIVGVPPAPPEVRPGLDEAFAADQPVATMIGAPTSNAEESVTDDPAATIAEVPTAAVEEADVEGSTMAAAEVPLASDPAVDRYTVHDVSSETKRTGEPSSQPGLSDTASDTKASGESAPCDEAPGPDANLAS